MKYLTYLLNLLGHKKASKVCSSTKNIEHIGYGVLPAKTTGNQNVYISQLGEDTASR